MTTEFLAPGGVASKLLATNEGWEIKKAELAGDMLDLQEHSYILHIYTWHDDDINEETGELISKSGWTHVLTFGAEQLALLMKFLEGQKKQGRIE